MKRCLLFLTIVSFICTACFDQKIEPLRESGVTLKILTDRKEFAEQRYLDVFKLYFPNVNVLFINEGYEQAKESGEWGQWFEQHQPDLIMLLSGRDGSIFKKYIEDQLVEPLDPYILRDQYSLENMAPGALEWLRMQSLDNQLYALANEFYNEVIFYNTKHFDALNIPYPNTRLSWIELLQLATRFQDAENEIYGLQATLSSPLEVLHEAAFSENLTLLDVEKEEVYIRSAAWKKIFEEVVTAYQSGMIYHQHEGRFPDHVAMLFAYGAVAEYNALIISKYAAEHRHWDVIHYPGKSENPKLRVDYPISIYSHSPNKEHAWQLLKFMTGPELARYELKAKSKGTDGLPIWISNIEQLHVENTAAFYDAMPSTRENPNYRQEIRLVQPLLQQYLEAVIAEEIGLDQALEELDEKIMELLKQGGLQ